MPVWDSSGKSRFDAMFMLPATRPPLLPLRRPAPFGSRCVRSGGKWPIASRQSGRDGRRPTNRTIPAAEAGEANDTGKTASGSTDSPDNLVALVLARPEINSLSDLNNKSIAIEEKQSAASGSVSAALMAAGAAEVQFSEVTDRGDRPADQRRSPGRGSDAGLARSRRVVSRLSKASGRFGSRSR